MQHKTRSEIREIGIDFSCHDTLRLILEVYYWHAGTAY